MTRNESQRGLTLLEALIAVAIVGIALAALFPTFLTQMDANTRNEDRTGAVAAAQQVMEQLRREDPASLPISGARSRQVTMGDQNYDAVERYCMVPDYCGAGSRHVRLEVSLDAQVLYTVETVYTQLR